MPYSNYKLYNNSKVCCIDPRVHVHTAHQIEIAYNCKGNCIAIDGEYIDKWL